MSHVPKHHVLLGDLSPVLAVGVRGWGHRGQVRGALRVSREKAELPVKVWWLLASGEAK